MFTVLSQELIKNHNFFCDINNDFDEKNNVKTYVGKSTIKNILVNFPSNFNRSIDQLTHDRIEFEIDRSFNFFNTTSYKLSQLQETKRFFFFHALYMFFIDFKNNIDIQDPITLTRFDNGVTVWHPGQKRYYLHSVYEKEIFFMLTDHSKKEKIEILNKCEDVPYNWSKGTYYLRIGNYDERMHSNNINKKSKFKDIFGQIKNREGKFDNFHKLHGSFYQITDKSIKVNNKTIAIKKNNFWRVSFDES